MKREFELYSGLRLLGMVRDQGEKGWSAVDDEFRPLGTFPDQKKAEAAVIAAGGAIDRVGAPDG
jgi:hypothetical protein